MAVEPILEARDIHRRFPGVHALDNAGLRLFPGEIHALMGQNGAGKSTLIKVLTGVYGADQGSMTFAGHPWHPRSPVEAQRAGISTVYQEVNLCANLSVAENIFAGRYPRRGLRGGWRIDWPRVAEGARALLARLNLDIDVTRPLGDYSLAVRQMVAIARSLGTRSQVLVLDEPTSSLDDGEVERLFAVLRQMRAEGMAILFVTHFLDQVYALCDRITVLRNGELVCESTPAALPPRALVAAMVGRELQLDTGLAAAASDSDMPAGVPVLEAHGLARRGQVRPTDLALGKGEVLGLAGLLGSGRTELVRLLFGLDRADQGSLSRDGRPVLFDGPLAAIRSGLAFCPEDRKGEGIIGELSLADNIILALQARSGMARRLPRRQCEAVVRHYVQLLGIRAADIDAPIAQLSGGNQQKAVLARWLATDPAVLILDEPTRGIDVAAKQEILAEIRRLAVNGLAVLFISSEMDEVVRIADRIAILRDRRKVGELPGGSDEQAVFRMIAAGAA